MPQWTIVYVVAFWVGLLALSALCFFTGDRCVKLTAGTYCAAMILQRLLRKQVYYFHLMTFAMAIDLTLLLALVVFAIKHPRWWLRAMAALQLIACLGHLAKILNPQMSRLTYAILIGGSGYPMLILLAIGLIASIRSRGIEPHHPA